MNNIERYKFLKKVLVRYKWPRVLEIIEEMDRLVSAMTIWERALANNI